MDSNTLYNGKRYRTFDYEMKRIYCEKVIKLSIDGGFSCPNRQGSGGCIFCSEAGSGEFAGNINSRNASISEQIKFQKEMLSSKWKSSKYIAYFQSYTNTYAPVNVLKNKYNEALSNDVFGLAIATRPDCLGDDVLDLIQSYTCPLWLELGLQTVNSYKQINRGYNNEYFAQKAHELNERKIPFVTHIIFGLPWDGTDAMLDTVRFAVNCGTWGIKMHMLYIDKTAPLYNYYINTSFHVLSLDEYADIITEALAIIPPETVIHRITGDGKKQTLAAPLWTADKRRVLNTIDKLMKNKNYIQGCKI